MPSASHSAIFSAGSMNDSSPPSIPTGVVATAGNTQIVVTWVSSSDDTRVVGYKLYVNGTYKTSSLDTSKTITGLTNGTSYSITVAAYDAMGNTSGRSSPVTATPADSGTTIALFDPNTITSDYTNIDGRRLWYGVQRPNSPGADGAEQTDRIKVVTAADVPGQGQDYCPSGQALRFEIRPLYSTQAKADAGGTYDGDVTITGDLQRSRSEVLTSGTDGTIPYEQQRWIGWAMYLDPSWQFDIDNWIELTQIKNSSTGSPPIAIGLTGRHIEVEGVRADGDTKFSPVRVGDIEVGRWYYFQFGIRTSLDASVGSVELWIDNIQVLAPINRTTAVDSGNGTPQNNYLKQGIYQSSAWPFSEARHIRYQGATVIGTTRSSSNFQGI